MLCSVPSGTFRVTGPLSVSWFLAAGSQAREVLRGGRHTGLLLGGDERPAQGGDDGGIRL